jgi:hypothetical protein
VLVVLLEMQDLLVTMVRVVLLETQEIMVTMELVAQVVLLELMVLVELVVELVEQHNGVVVVLMEWVVTLVLLQLQTVLEVEELDVGTKDLLYSQADLLDPNRLVLLDLVEEEEVSDKQEMQEQVVVQDKQDLLE